MTGASCLTGDVISFALPLSRLLRRSCAPGTFVFEVDTPFSPFSRVDHPDGQRLTDPPSPTVNMKASIRRAEERLACSFIIMAAVTSSKSLLLSSDKLLMFLLITRGTPGRGANIKASVAHREDAGFSGTFGPIDGPTVGLMRAEPPVRVDPDLNPQMRHEETRPTPLTRRPFSVTSAEPASAPPDVQRPPEVS